MPSLPERRGSAGGVDRRFFCGFTDANFDTAEPFAPTASAEPDPVDARRTARAGSGAAAKQLARNQQPDVVAAVSAGIWASRVAIIGRRIFGRFNSAENDAR